MSLDLGLCAEEIRLAWRYMDKDNLGLLDLTEVSSSFRTLLMPNMRHATYNMQHASAGTAHSFFCEHVCTLRLICLRVCMHAHEIFYRQRIRTAAGTVIQRCVYTCCTCTQPCYTCTRAAARSHALAALCTCLWLRMYRHNCYAGALCAGPHSSVPLSQLGASACMASHQGQMV